MNFIKKWFEKLRKERELNRLTENTLLYSQAGMINNPNICIKGQTTCVCVCKNCTEEQYKQTKKLLDKYYFTN